MKPSIYIGVIAWRQIEAGCVYQLFQSALNYHDRVQLDIHSGDAMVDRARGTLATRFYRDTPYDVLVTVDSDIVFDPAQLVQIAEQAYDLKAIVAGVYATRSAEKAAPSSMLNDTPIRFENDPTPVPIRWAATGFMAVERSVFTRLLEDPYIGEMCHTGQGREMEFYPFYYMRDARDDEGRRIYLSEDFAFCEHAAAVGVQTYINPAVRLGHIGNEIFRLEHMAWKTPPQMPMTLTRQGLRYGVEADVPPDLVPFAKGTPQPEKLSRQQMRHMERQREKVTA